MVMHGICEAMSTIVACVSRLCGGIAKLCNKVPMTLHTFAGYVGQSGVWPNGDASYGSHGETWSLSLLCWF